MSSQPEIKCPGGTFAVDPELGPGVRCGPDGGKHVAVISNPKAVMGYCSDRYGSCPVWIAERERDPAVLAAQGRPLRRRCPDCDGTGIQHEEVFQSGMFIMNEVPCDFCLATGLVDHGPDLEERARDDEVFMDELQKAMGPKGDSTIHVTRGFDG